MPHTPDGLRKATYEAVLAQAPHAQFHRLDDDEAYWRLLDGLWRARESFVIVEQDIVPNPDSIERFHECTELWCTHAYDYGIFGLYAGSGCVRFRAELLHETPGLIGRVGEMSDATHPKKHWCRLDGWTQQLLHATGYVKHLHQPAVQHLDTGVSHGCVA